MDGDATPAFDHGDFRKSSYSGEDGNSCVEIAVTLDAVRDTKNPAGPVLRVDLGSFLTEIKSGRLCR